MTDTIEWLETIGRDASLRHASAEQLTSRLEAPISVALAAAIASGDSARLFDEFGHKPMQTPQISQAPGHEDDDQGEDDSPLQPSEPDVLSLSQ